MKVIPLWYDIDQSEVEKYDPLLADRLAEKIHQGNIKSVASKINASLGGSISDLPTVSVICWNEKIYHDILNRMDTEKSNIDVRNLKSGVISSAKGPKFTTVVGYPRDRQDSLTIQEIISNEVEADLLITLGTATGFRDTNAFDVVVANPYRGYSDNKDRITKYPSGKMNTILLETIERLKKRSWQRYVSTDNPKYSAEIKIGPVAAGGSLINSEKDFMEHLHDQSDCIAVTDAEPEFYEWKDNLRMEYLKAYVVQDSYESSKESPDIASEYAVAFLISFIEYARNTRETLSL